MILILSGATIMWYFDKDSSKIYRDGNKLAETRWVMNSERTFIVKDSWYDENVKCPKIIDMGGHETRTRCYYPDGYYEQLSRSLINTEVTEEDLEVHRKTPYYMYGTRGSYAGYFEETFKFINPTDKEEEFPKDYISTWKPRDTRNYKAVLRVWALKEQPLADGKYHACKYYAKNLMIDLKDECDRLDYAEVEDDRIYFWFKPQRGDQSFDIDIVDPVWEYDETGASGDLVGHWKFDGNADDSSGYDIDSRTEDNIAIVPGKFGLAYDFDGDDSRVRVIYEDLLNFTKYEGLTFSGWIKPSGLGEENFGRILAFPSRVEIYVSSGCGINYRFYNATDTKTANTGAACELNGSWTHFVAVYNGSTIIPYIDGVRKTSDEFYLGGDIRSVSGNGFIGDNAAETRNLDGLIDDVRIYNRSLTDDEIKELYDQTLKSNSFSIYGSSEEAKTYAYGSQLLADGDMEKTNVDMSENVLNMPFYVNSTTVTDYSGYSNDGTLGDGSNTSEFPTFNSSCGAFDGSAGCWEFDGVDDYIEIRDSASNSPRDEVTVSVWVFDNNLTANVGYVWKNSYNYIIYNGGGSVYFRVYNSTPADSVASFGNGNLNSGWNHIIGTFNGTNSLLYLNGQIADDTSDILTDESGHPIRDAGGNLFIGRRGIDVAETFFNGSIDQVQIFNRTLNETEIQDLYERTKAVEDWNEGNDAIVSKQVYNPKIDDQVIRVEHNGTNNPYTHQSIFTLGKDYRVTGWGRGDGNAYPRLYKVDGETWWAGTTSTDWQYFDVIMDDLSNSNIFITANTDTQGEYAEFDQVTVKEVESKDSDKHLVSHWKFNGDATDSAGNNDGEVYGASIVPGHEGLAYDFDGEDDKIEVDYSSDSPLNVSTNDFTVMAWVKIREFGNNERIIVNRAPSYNDYVGYEIRINNGDEIEALQDYGVQASLQTVSGLETNTWYHVVSSVDRDGYAKLYVNGIEEDNDDISSHSSDSLSNNDLDITIGEFVGAHFNGTIDDMRIYNVSLSEDEVLQIYNETKQSHSLEMYGNNEEAKTYAYGSQLLADGDMEAAGVGDWLAINDANLTKQTDNPKEGSQVLRIQYDGVDTPIAYQSVLNEEIYRVTGWARSDGNHEPKVSLSGSGNMEFQGTTSTDWQYFDFIIDGSTGTQVYFYSNADASGEYVEFDAVTVREVESQNSDETLLAHYKMNGDVSDETGNYDATNYGARVAPGKFDLAADFEDSYYIDIPVNAFPSYEHGTISWWADVDTRESQVRMWGSDDTEGDEFRTYSSTNNTLTSVFYNSSTSLETVSIYPTSGFYAWHHYVLRWQYINDTTKIDSYVDGNSKDTTTLQGRIERPDTNLYIARWGNVYFDGRMDDVRLYNETLHEDEIQQLYDQTKHTSLFSLYGNPEVT